MLNQLLRQLNMLHNSQLLLLHMVNQLPKQQLSIFNSNQLQQHMLIKQI